MNRISNLRPVEPGQAPGSEIDAVFEAQRRAQLARRPSFDRKARIAQLDRLRDTIRRREADIIAACAADFPKPASEVKLTEMLPVLQEIQHTKRHLRKWMRPRRVAAPLVVQPATAKVVPEPLGVALIIAPWNYPLMLALSPLVGAISAGNAAVVKPSELAPRTSAACCVFWPELLPSRSGTLQPSAVRRVA